MRQLPGWVWLLVAIVFASLASYMALGWLKRQATAPIAKEKPSLMVVVATAKVGPGIILNAAQLKTKIWQGVNPPQDFFSNQEQVVGRETRTALNPDDPITRENTRDKSEGMSSKVSPDKRAMTVKVDEVSGVAGFLVIGNRVDVMVTVDKGKYDKDPITKTLFQKLKVLGVGQRMESVPGDKPQVVPTVTLEVDPQQGERLALAAQEGRLSLVLRSPGDQELVQTTGVDTATLLGLPSKANKKVPPVAPPRRTVEVIRGLQRSPVEF